MRHAVGTSALLPALLPGCGAVAREAAVPVARIARLDIGPAQVERYTAAVRAEIKASVCLEPGVLAIYAVAEKDRPSRFRFFEVHADAAAYAAHVASAHFRTHADATKDMIMSKRLIETVPVQLSAKSH